MSFLVNLATRASSVLEGAEEKSDTKPLHKACRDGNLEKVKKSVEERDPDVNAKTEMNIMFMAYAVDNAPLHFAAIRKYDQIIEELLKHPDIDVNITNGCGYTPLHVMAYYDKTEGMRKLLEHPNINVNAKENEEKTPLLLAVSSGNIEPIKILLESSKIDVNAKNAGNYTSLFEACRNGFVGAVCELLKHPKVDKNSRFKGKSPIEIACKNEHPDVVKYLLLDPSVHVDFEKLEKNTLLLAIFKAGRMDLYRKFLQFHEIDEDLKNDQLFFAACHGGNIDIIEEVLSMVQPNVNGYDKHGNTPMHLACHARNLEVVKFLDEHFDVNFYVENKQGLLPDQLCDDEKIKRFIKKKRAGLCRVHVRKGRDIWNPNWITSCNPYVVVKGSEDDQLMAESNDQNFVLKTKAVNGEEDPEWDFCSYINVDDCALGKLKFEVFDKNMLARDVFIAEGIVQVHDLNRKTPKNTWISINTPEGMERGQIQVSIEALDFGKSES